MFRLIAATSLALSFAASAHASSVLMNGGFETGDFTGWTQVSGTPGLDCSADWYVSATDTQCSAPFSDLNGAPEGGFAAYNAFDGDANTNYTIEQDVVLTSRDINSATLSWQQSYGWFIAAGAAATQDRIFSLSFYDVTDALIGHAYSLNVGPGDGGTGVFVDWESQSVNVTGLLQGYEGETVSLVANVFIPESLTGPGSFGADAFDLQVAPIPLPASLSFLIAGLLGLGGLRRMAS